MPTAPIMLIRFHANESMDLIVQPESISIREYLREPERIVAAIADPSLTEMLEPGLFRLKMRSIYFLSYEFQPVVTLAVRTDEQDIVHLQAIDCYLKGLESFMDGFKLNLEGQLIPLMKQDKMHLQGKVDLAVQLLLPKVFLRLPKSLFIKMGNHLLGEILMRIKKQLLTQLVQDYKTWVKTQEKMPIALLKPPSF